VSLAAIDIANEALLRLGEATISAGTAVTPNAAAVVDNSDGTVTLPATAHGISAGRLVGITGTTNYDGEYILDSATAANTIVVTATYTAEDLTSAARVTPLFDTTPNGVVCERMYRNLRRRMLSAFPWGFAVGEEDLTEDTDQEDARWTYAFDLPADYLRAIDINGDETAEFEVLRAHLFCDADEVALRYLASADDPADWPAWFRHALVLQFAADLAMPVTGSADILTAMITLAGEALREAKTADASENRGAVAVTRTIADSRW